MLDAICTSLSPVYCKTILILSAPILILVVLYMFGFIRICFLLAKQKMGLGASDSIVMKASMRILWIDNYQY